MFEYFFTGKNKAWEKLLFKEYKGQTILYVMLDAVEIYSWSYTLGAIMY